MSDSVICHAQFCHVPMSHSAMSLCPILPSPYVPFCHLPMSHSVISLCTILSSPYVPFCHLPMFNFVILPVPFCRSSQRSYRILSLGGKRLSGYSGYVHMYNPYFMHIVKFKNLEGGTQARGGYPPSPSPLYETCSMFHSVIHSISPA